MEISCPRATRRSSTTPVYRRTDFRSQDKEKHGSQMSHNPRPRPLVEIQKESCIHTFCWSLPTAPVSTNGRPRTLVWLPAWGRQAGRESCWRAMASWARITGFNLYAPSKCISVSLPWLLNKHSSILDECLSKKAFWMKSTHSLKQVSGDYPLLYIIVIYNMWFWMTSPQFLSFWPLNSTALSLTVKCYISNNFPTRVSTT